MVPNIGTLSQVFGPNFPIKGRSLDHPSSEAHKSQNTSSESRSLGLLIEGLEDRNMLSLGGVVRSQLEVEPDPSSKHNV
jgi:hypothetical protein